jgi:radical SAM-linked protein
VPTGREYIGRWEETLGGGGLPVVCVASGRPRIALGAPLPAGSSADGEILEFWLTEVKPAWIVREALAPRLPHGHRAVGLESVWLGAPALSGQIAAADYEVTVGAGERERADVDDAVRRLLARDRLLRQRQKGGETRIYDLRALVVSLEATRVAGDGLALHMRTLIHPELGTGRPDEVVAALSDEAGTPLTIEGIVRRRLLLADDLEG